MVIDRNAALMIARDRAYIERMAISSLVSIRPRRSPPIFVCKKCLSRIDDGKKLRKALKSETEHRSASRNAKPPRVVLTSCFGICPKRSVVVASAETLARGEYLLLSDSGAAEKAAAILMGEPGSSD